MYMFCTYIPPAAASAGGTASPSPPAFLSPSHLRKIAADVPNTPSLICARPRSGSFLFSQWFWVLALVTPTFFFFSGTKTPEAKLASMKFPSCYICVLRMIDSLVD
ncbi:hypothetical protein AMECASPLE_029195 [Ameca splendens]|uniref:Uncharacterized protein n=1 Tax=Ameca splendens TaxID=208324 RepID=A0ABV0ZSJ8_9TELE